MENANLLIAFVAVTAAAVVIRAGILIGMYLSARKTSAMVEGLAVEIKDKVLPTADVVKSMLAEMRPKLETLVTNVSDSSVMVRAQLERIDATLNDVIDRTRLQVIRADEIVGRTLERVEQTTDLVHKTVVSPVRQVSGVIQGVTVALDFLMSGRRRRRDGVPAAQDEMFI
jgi:methyl-accepting chemotaxis protein